MIYAYKSNGSIQTYEEHIQGMLECWEKIGKKYKRTLRRILNLDFERIDFLIKAMIILHDSGKCTEFYQDVITRNEGVERDRHEIIPKTKEELDIYQIEVKEVKERNEYLEEEMRMIKELYEDLVSKWQTASLRIIELEKDKEDIKSEYEHKIK